MANIVVTNHSQPRRERGKPAVVNALPELAAVACLIGQGNTGLPLKVHLNGMLNVGWKKEEIIETLIFLTGYVGFPSCVDVFGMLKKILVDNEK